MTKKETGLVKVKKYMNNDVVKNSFVEILGKRGASAYVNAVMTAVIDNAALQECQPESIYIQAMRAATLQLSVDPGIAQAYLVPYGGKCQLIVGWRGLREMAIRTNQYRYINVTEVWEGQEVKFDQITGRHSIDGFKANRKSKHIGWLGAFELMNGFAVTIYMDLEEIHAHRDKYAQGLDRKSSPWNTETKKMEKKTVMRRLIRDHGKINPSDLEMLEQIESDELGEDEIVDLDFSESEVHDNDPWTNDLVKYVLENTNLAKENEAVNLLDAMSCDPYKKAQLDICLGHYSNGINKEVKDPVKYMKDKYQKGLTEAMGSGG